MPEFRTSTYCGGGACVEVAFETSSYCTNATTCVEVGYQTSSRCADGTCVEVGYHTSSHCAGRECVEVGASETAILVRDGKNKTGHVLTFTPNAWAEFMSGVRAGTFG